MKNWNQLINNMRIKIGNEVPIPIFRTYYFNPTHKHLSNLEITSKKELFVNAVRVIMYKSASRLGTFLVVCWNVGRMRGKMVRIRHGWLSRRQPIKAACRCFIITGAIAIVNWCSAFGDPENTACNCFYLRRYKNNPWPLMTDRALANWPLTTATSGQRL